MKWLAALLLVGAGIAHADIKMEFVEKVIPTYPQELLKSAISGSVRIGFDVLADGSVRNVKVLQSSDPAFANSALKAARKWRFKPWTVSRENPEKVDVQTNLYFRLNDKEEWWDIYERAGLILKTCKQFNEEVALYRKDDEKRPLDEMNTTLLSIRMISDIPKDGATSYEYALATSKAFNKALPKIIEQCRAFPGVDYVDLWPAALRERLVPQR
ncbi:energy transducer TonB [Pseudomonas sp. P66]|uniref:Protein TonB n=1 Tax=Pseudomonas arcuscaelestis TaxID=2710591 RepID=A0ABS2BR21_9PSED|nr:energy transducer TonB [Pseudomonas arcuscaelestis]MBM3110820.1 energy transducer TonB [Pseudomonas arcuscaelestis]MBM5456074.1 energy transducer TonB [Pseudomonas arcuscaelestis]